MSSKRASESVTPLDGLAEELPTTREDVEALRRSREQIARGFSPEQIDRLRLPDWLPRPRRHRTFEGYEPFEL